MTETLGELLQTLAARRTGPRELPHAATAALEDEICAIVREAHPCRMASVVEFRCLGRLWRAYLADDEVFEVTDPLELPADIRRSAA